MQPSPPPFSANRVLTESKEILSGIGVTIGDPTLPSIQRVALVLFVVFAIALAAIAALKAPWYGYAVLFTGFIASVLLASSRRT